MSLSKAVSLHPYFAVKEGKLDEFKNLCEEFVKQTATEGDTCLYYDFTINEADNEVFCREAYVDAEATMKHLGNVGKLIDIALTISTLRLLEVHGPAAELDKLREPLAPLHPEYYVHEIGVERSGRA